MTPYEEAVRRALSADDLRLYDRLGRPQNPVQLAFATFATGQRGFYAAVWAAGFLLFAVAVYAGFRFAEAPDVRGMADWGAIAALAALGLGLVKLWCWMEIQKLTVLRALKRMELQIGALCGPRS